MFESLRQLFSGFENFNDSKTIMGEPVNVGYVTLVPVISMKIGLGSGQSEFIGVGGGGGITIEPRALVIIQGDHVVVYSLDQEKNHEPLSQILPELGRLWERELEP